MYLSDLTRLQSPPLQRVNSPPSDFEETAQNAR
jgi:hypothetical protein